MSAKIFVNTNILVYAGSAHPDDAAKRSIALRNIAPGGRRVFCPSDAGVRKVAYRKRRLALTQQEALAALRALALRPVVAITAELVLRAAAVSDRFRISYWDAAIVAAALELGCHTLYSEDLSHHQNYDGLTVVNPFI